MNCPSRTEPEIDPSWNQNPNSMASDLTTRSDLGKMASARRRQDHKLDKVDQTKIELIPISDHDGHASSSSCDGPKSSIAKPGETAPASSPPPTCWRKRCNTATAIATRAAHCTRRPACLSFVGPGFMIAVAYIDPGNYATDAAAGASYQYKLLFMILLSNIFAIFLQSLCIKLSSVTGLNLAEMNKAHTPRWLNYVLWLFGEAAVIATDIAEVIGFAIALNLLAPAVPLVVGCAISILDVMFILMFYRPDGGMKMLRVFEGFIMVLVMGVAVCFCYQLSLIHVDEVSEVFRGFLPSSALIQSQGLYQACGILGATVMPHSLYLGSGLNQPRLREYDIRHHHYPNPANISHDEDDSIHLEKYRPSLSAIQHCMKMSIWELGISLFTFALFINSAILIVCGASLYSVDGADAADLFQIYDLLQQQVAPAAGTVFAVALLLSGCSAGIVCTMAGQMISEGQLEWKCKPWLTRLITRSISILPAILVAGLLGRDGLSEALVASQVALSAILPFVSAPVIYYTCRNKYMTVTTTRRTGSTTTTTTTEVHKVLMRNSWITAGFAVAIWSVIVIMNVANLVLVGLGVN
ncbi:divalent metal ion transporter [Dissoconium aciculare CBS 342.82]|uniref:Divalent metal ion transporter n=1 Tax=Dissoconium aciculare CBS 342.82 TaxID=1314786 RepID=A0A6J3M689_9PEZI|nr:divalent metal ion transporter [Dissoconium aciculare CBS 342.82]KAF1822387.1 divalent metal ion transporter [Dissoconium aciculare CBS 342.82]